MVERIWYEIGKGLVHLFGHIMLQIDIHRRAPVPKGPVILAANHPSIIDPALITILTPTQVSILIIDTLFKVPLFGRSLRLSGHIPVVCGGGQEALEQARQALEEGKSVAVFPEGVISPMSGGFHKPRTGIARLALSTGLPVVPVGIHLDPAQIRVIHSRVDGKEETGTWYFSGPYAMTVGEPMVFKGEVEDREYVRQVTGRVMQRIIQLSSESAMRIHTREKPERLVMAGVHAVWQMVYRYVGALASIRII